MSLRVLLCCDQALMAAGLRALLERRGMAVCHEAHAGRAAVVVRDREPDVVLGVSPALTLAHQRELAHLAELSRVVLLTGSEGAGGALEALRAGVRAMLSAESSDDALVLVLRTVVEMDGVVLRAPAHGADLAAAYRDATHPAVGGVNALTAREAEVLLLLAQGCSNATIAARLSISTATVRSHVHHLLSKLGARTRGQAVAVAYDTGLLTATGHPPGGVPLGDSAAGRH